MSNDTKVDDTAEIGPLGDTAAGVWPRSVSAGVRVEVAAQSHQGFVRRMNEDHFLVVRFGRMLEPLFSNLPHERAPPKSEEVGYGLIVADGIGGAAGGDIASSLAISTLHALVMQTPDWILGTDVAETERVLQRMAERFRRIQQAMVDYAERRPLLEEMGTTLTLAASLGTCLIVGHIGDSRAYLLRGGVLFQLTRDHTVAQDLVDQGRLTPEQAALHPKRHALTRCVGATGDTFEGDFERVWLADGDQLLVCTDGLPNMVDDKTIATILNAAAPVEDSCRALIDAALRRGGKDNITVALARYRIGE